MFFNISTVNLISFLILRMTLLHPAISGVDKQLSHPGEKVLRHFSFALHSEQQKINTSFFIKIMLEFSVKCPQCFFVF